MAKKSGPGSRGGATKVVSLSKHGALAFSGAQRRGGKVSKSGTSVTVGKG